MHLIVEYLDKLKRLFSSSKNESLKYVTLQRGDGFYFGTINDPALTVYFVYLSNGLFNIWCSKISLEPPLDSNINELITSLSKYVTAFSLYRFILYLTIALKRGLNINLSNIKQFPQLIMPALSSSDSPLDGLKSVVCTGFDLGSDIELKLAELFLNQAKATIAKNATSTSILGTVSRKEGEQVSDFDITDVEDIITTEYKNNNYTDLLKIGQGSFGVTYTALDKELNKTIVIKVLTKDKTDKQAADSEVRALRGLKDRCEPYLLCYIDYMEDEKNYYITTEFLGQYVPLDRAIQDKLIAGGDMLTVVSNMIQGLKVLHDAGYVHRDIKPANIMIKPSDGSIKYIDFGLACDKCTIQPAGTLSYMAPEVYTDLKLLLFKDWIKADIWSLGMTIFNLLYGLDFIDTYMVDVKDIEEVKRIQAKPYDVILKFKDIGLPIAKYLPNLDETYLAVISNMTDFDPSKRELPQLE